MSPRRSTSSSASSPSSPSPTTPPSSPTSPTSSSADPTAASLLFQPPSGPEPLAETPSSSPEPPLPDDGPDSGSATPSSETDEPSYAGDEQPKRPQLPRASKRKLIPAARTAVQTIGGIVHQVLTVEESLEREYQLFLPDEEDVEAIAEPLAGLASRRVPEGAGDPDVADLLQLAVGLAGYVVKQLHKRSAIRALRRQLQNPPPVDHAAGTEEAAA